MEKGRGEKNEKMGERASGKLNTYKRKEKEPKPTTQPKHTKPASQPIQLD